MGRTITERNNIAASWDRDVAQVSLHSADPTPTSGATLEVTGGSYARVTAPTATTPTTGLVTWTVTHNVPSGQKVGGVGFWDGAGNFLEGYAIANPVTFSAAGTYTTTVNGQA